MKENIPLPGLDDISHPQGRVNARRHLKNCIFVSHSSKDWSFIKDHIEETLHQALSVATYTRKDGTWSYPYALFCFSFAKARGLYAPVVNMALTEARAFVLVASQSATTSDWVKKELTYADRRFRQILAIAIDNTSFRVLMAVTDKDLIFGG